MVIYYELHVAVIYTTWSNDYRRYVYDLST